MVTGLSACNHGKRCGPSLVRLPATRVLLRMRRPRRARDFPIVASAEDTRRSNVSRSPNPAKSAAVTAQPDSKMNSVALETAVIATGARPGITGQRELFTEETTTALVFENGGVLRLAAAVVPGQLLFLTNRETRREVVAQVTRKRDFTPTSCYVEVQFSEPSPGFWGIEFSETPHLAPANAQQREAVDLVHSAKVVSGKRSTPAPSAQEVSALKQEVKALREQLKLLQTQAPAVNPSAPASGPVPAVIPGPPPAAAIAEAPSEPVPTESSTIANALGSPSSRLPSALPEIHANEPASTPLASAALPIEPGGPSFSEALHAPKPVIRVNRAKTADHQVAKSAGMIDINRRAKVPRIALLSAALLLVMLGAALYLQWIPGLAQMPRISFSAPPPGAPSVVVHPVPAASTAPPKTSDARTDSGKTTPSSEASTVQPGANLPGTSSPGAGAAGAPQFAALQEAAKPAPLGDSAPSTIAKPAAPASVHAAVEPAAVQTKSALAASALERSAPRPSIKTTAISAALPSLASASVVPPKLIKSVRAIASPNALEYFARDKTATVTLDAVVDPAGRVKSMKVLSGPASLRESAIDALKQYRYEPATFRGKPIAAHVTVPIKFLFEP